MKAVEGWSSSPLGELLISKNDKSKQVKSTEYAPIGSYPVVDQSSEFICGYHDDKTKLIETKLPLTVFGDHTRHTKFISFPFICGADGTQLIKPKNGFIDKFFFYLVAWAAGKIGNYGYDRHFKHLKEFECDYPDDPTEQTKIAEILSTVDRAIDQTEKLIAKEQRIKTGLMQDLLTSGIDEHGNLRSEQTHEFKDSPLGRIPVEWEIRKLDCLTKAIIDCPHTTPKFTQDGILVARTFNVKDGQFLGERSYVSEVEYSNRILRLEPQQGDVIFTREAPVGEAYVIPANFKVCLGQRTMLLRCDPNECLPEYLIEVIYSEEMRNRFDQKVGGTTNPHLNVGDVRSFDIKQPPINEQQKIITLLVEVRRAFNWHSQEKFKLHSLKTGLMQDLLTGRKRVIALLKDTEEITS